jgi:hypothetical protein
MPPWIRPPPVGEEAPLAVRAMTEGQGAVPGVPALLPAALVASAVPGSA